MIVALELLGQFLHRGVLQESDDLVDFVAAGSGNDLHDLVLLILGEIDGDVLDPLEVVDEVVRGILLRNVDDV